MLLDPERIKDSEEKTSPVGCLSSTLRFVGSQNSWILRSQKPAITQSNPSIKKPKDCEGIQMEC